MKNSIFRTIAISILIILFILLSLVISINYENIANWLYPKNDNKNGELLKIILSVLGALGVVYGLHISLRRAKAIEKGIEKQSEALDLQSDQINLSRISQINEQFKNAVEHLGSDKEPIILGGVSELHQIAKENPDKYSEIVFNILTAYIRSNTKREDLHNVEPEKEKEEEDIKEAEKTSNTVIQTIVDFIFDKNANYYSYKADLSRCDLAGVNFIDLDLRYVNFYKSKMGNLTSCDIDSADFSNAVFFLSSLKNLNFSNTKINYTLFFRSSLNNIVFENLVDTYELNFLETDLEDVKFNEIEMIGWNFISCNIQKCSFHKGEINSSDFCYNTIDNSIFDNPRVFRNDFRATSFNNVKFKNMFVIGCNFNGIQNLPFNSLKRIVNIDSILNESADEKGIELENSRFDNDCTFDSISESDFFEIKTKYNTLGRLFFNKDLV
ncbi:pentapeptide repeat-containing protein [uncultured Tenacibaculum sp.]|uniref:pentapeptide repeat-containing protein n=1 Tax=uncultured Tenacibaculum sp. TaxID=174713 RepID=UPI00262B482D|nr:pentapeptide repeat-containing protein [uncultured Tenacibaculum sp.]